MNPPAHPALGSDRDSGPVAPTADRRELWRRRLREYVRGTDAQAA